MSKILQFIFIIIIINITAFSEGYVDINQSGYVNGHMVNVRLNESTSSTSKGYLLHGTVLDVKYRTAKKDTISGSSNYWYFCDHCDGCYGWIFGDFVKLGKNPDDIFTKYVIPNFPDNFTIISEYSWSDIAPQDRNKGERGGRDEFFTIRNNILILDTDYLLVPKYLIEEVNEVSSNHFVLKIRLIAIDSRVNKKETQLFDIHMIYNPKTEILSLNSKSIKQDKLYRCKKLK
ncbi:MAG TPA: SH3 domain-containing protein [Spirochaetota bacterium]|nr:SH3 domain-containing protein [Spirochaetota bacterium]